LTDARKGESAGSTAGAGADGPPVGAEVRVDSLKYDGRLHRSWTTRLARRDGALLVLEGSFEAEVRHGLLGIIAKGTLSTEYYWTDRWYSVFRFREPRGALRYYYCNVNRPPEFDGSLLSFVDLDIDVLVSPDFTYAVLDEEEFAVNAGRFGYTDDILLRVSEARAELIRLIEARAFPFDEAT
jgi:protein associated with RNAse G/E